MTIGSRTVYHDATILVVDDEESNLRLLGRLLDRAGYTRVVPTSDSAAALDLFESVAPDLVVLDLNMPPPDGYEIMRELETRIPPESYLPVLVVSAEFALESKERALSSVAKDFLGKPFDTTEVLLRIHNLLHTRALHTQMERQNRSLEEMVRARTRALEQAQAETLRRLAQAAEFRDDDTGQHTRRVGELAARIARHLGLPAETAELIREAAPLHDVGKIGIPDNILLKRGPLTDEETAVMRTHTLIGARLLSDGRSAVAELAEEIAAAHHERWDGSGYPKGLAGEAIPLSARIVAVADFYDALSHARPYRSAWAHEAVIAEIRKQCGRHFDPEVVNAFVEISPTLDPHPAHEASR